MSKISPQFIAEVWHRNRANLFDLLGANSKDLDIITEGWNTAENIHKVINSYTKLKSEYPSFFSKQDYSWCFEPASYRTATESSFQFRILAMLAKLYTTQQILVSDTIVVREAFISGSMIYPMTVNREGIAFIVFPLGWFEYEHFSAYGLDALTNEKQNEFIASVKGLSSKILAEVTVDKYREDHPDWDMEESLINLLGIQISKMIVEKEEKLSGALLDIGVDNFSRLGDLLAYACESFVLAHEAAHIIVKDHMNSSLKADELQADKLAFQILDFSKDVILADVGLQVESLPTLAAFSFIFVGNASIQTQKILNVANEKLVEEFRLRTIAIQEVAKSFNLPEQDLNKMKYLIHYMKQYLSLAKPVLTDIAEAKENIVANALSLIPQINIV